MVHFATAETESLEKRTISNNNLWFLYPQTVIAIKMDLLLWDVTKKVGNVNVIKDITGTNAMIVSLSLFTGLLKYVLPAQILLQCHLSTFKHCQKSKVSNSNIVYD